MSILQPTKHATKGEEKTKKLERLMNASFNTMELATTVVANSIQLDSKYTK
jgi:hypothetical protein